MGPDPCLKFLDATTTQVLIKKEAPKAAWLQHRQKASKIQSLPDSRCAMWLWGEDGSVGQGWQGRWQGTPGNRTHLASLAPAQHLFAERFGARGVLRNNLKSKGSSYANPQQLAARRKWLTLCLLFPMRHLCVQNLWEGERGIFSNRVCKQTLLIALLSLPAARRGKKGSSWSASCGKRDAFPQGNGQGSNWRAESRVRCVMTNAPVAQHLHCRVNKELQNLLGSEPCSPAAVTARQTQCWNYSKLKLSLTS